MTFDPDAGIRSGNTTRAGGRRGGVRPGGRGLALGGGGGALVLVAVVVWALLGGDPTALLGGDPGGTGSTGPGIAEGPLEECRTGQDANERDDCLVQATVESADSLWAGLGPAAGIPFEEPRARVFDGDVDTGCGPATADIGPFYCPADRTIYVDVAFFSELHARYGADGGQLAKMYVVAHEYGHHVQNLDGTMTRIDRTGTGPGSDAVRLELQADCYAGVWAHHASSTTDEAGVRMLLPLTDEDIDSALSAASAVGDDHLQGEVAGGQVRPDTWTHGSSDQRRTWFLTGYERGTVGACDTFSPATV